MSNAVYFSVFNVTKQIFFKSKYAYLLVNIRPLVPGHVLIVPYRVVVRLQDLTPDESQDYFETLQKIHKFIGKIYKSDALNISIQDGKLLGQSVPHLHTHIIPRYSNDGKGDGIYDDLENSSAQMEKDYSDRALFKKPDSERVNRTDEVMALEAEWLRLELAKYEQDL